jgi:transposase
MILATQQAHKTTDLPDDLTRSGGAAEVVDLRAIIEKNKRELKQQEQQIQEKNRRIEELLDLLILMRKQRFGRSSDVPHPGQENLFDEAELEELMGELSGLIDDKEDETVEESRKEDDSTNADTSPKEKPRRRPLPSALERIEKIQELSDSQKAEMGENWETEWELIGYDKSEQLATIPKQRYVIVYKRPKYVPVNESVTGADQGVVTAPRAAQIIPKSIAHHSLIADVMTAKFADGIPFYRQEKILARDGIELSRQTMSGWVIHLNRTFEPLMEAIRRHMIQGKVIHIDETPLQVLNEPKRENSQKSFMWVYKGGPPDQPVICFQYSEHRSGDIPVQFLFGEKSREGEDPPVRQNRFYSVTDGYSGYNDLSKRPEVIDRAGCWTHVRRKFVDATHGRKAGTIHHQIVKMIGKLYSIESKARREEMSALERHQLRQEKSTVVLAKIREWLDKYQPKVVPNSLLGQAIQYANNQWSTLTTFLQDGEIEIDNNIAENAIRPFAVGRKGWLFSGSPAGAEASATMYSLIESAKANGLEPWAYLNYLFENFPLAKSEEEIQALLPFNLKTEDLKREG